MGRVRTLVGWMAVVVLVSMTAESVDAQTSYPMTLRIDPIAVQRGRVAEITVLGRENWNGAWALLCEGNGLRGEISSVEKVEVPQTKARGGGRRGTTQVKGKLEVAWDAPLGPRELRVATPQGVSSVGVIVVVDAPVVAEADDLSNDRPAGAQRLALPAVVSGRVGKLEDVDWYAFDLVKGERVTFEVWGNRLENKIHDLQTHLDPILSLHDESGRELAAADNNRFADPLLSFVAPASATYYVQVRDTTYAGNAAWAYALHAVTGTATTSMFPLAVNPGTTAKLEPRVPEDKNAQLIEVAVPRDLESGVHLFAPARGAGGALPVPLWVTPLPIVVEKGDVPPGGEAGQKLTLPIAQCGQLAERGDADGYRFEAKKDLIYAFEVVARRAGSECDPVLRLLDQKGKAVAEVDDVRGLGKDSRIEWTAPADGTYVLQVADLHDRGGAAFGYVILAEVAQPDFTLTCDPDMINVGPGGRVPIFVRVARSHGFSGPVDLCCEGLPAGVSASPLVISASMNEGVIVVSAVQGAKRAAALVSLKATGRGPAGPIVRIAGPTEEIYLPGGGRGHWPVDTLALAVMDPSDITLEAGPREIVLTLGGSAALDVTVTRNARYEGVVNLAVVLKHLGGIHGNPLPPGVTVKESGGKMLLGPKETKGKIILQAAPDAAACEKVPIAVMGHVSINFVVKTAYASAPVLVSVRTNRK
jgi:Bacterial pre-peptidase C-terminal domain